MTWASATLGVLGNIGLAIGLVLWYLVLTVWLVLQTVYWPVAFLLQPLFFLGRFLAACLFLPVQIIIRLEVSHCFNRPTDKGSQCDGASNSSLWPFCLLVIIWGFAQILQCRPSVRPLLTPSLESIHLLRRSCDCRTQCRDSGTGIFRVVA